MEVVFLLLLIVLMIAALGSGFPVAFALPGAAIVSIGAAALAGSLFAGDSAAYFAQGSPLQWLTAGVTNFRDVYWDVERDTLIAIPLFIFMGIMLQRSKIAEDLLVTMAQLFGPVPGGLGISVVFVGALLAATTGIVGATVVAMGLISLPAMMRNKYSSPLACGTIAASGTLGQIIPPSIVLIILADQLANAVDQADTLRKQLYKDATGLTSLPSEFAIGSTSAGEMFIGALLPGLVLVAFYMIFIMLLAMMRPRMAPAVPVEGKFDAAFYRNVLITLVPPLALIIAVLGSIISGIATVNQAGAVGAVGAALMASYRLHEGKRGAYAPVVLAIVSVVALVIIMRLFNTNVKLVRTSSDVIGITLAAIAVVMFLGAVAWAFWRTYRFENTLYGVMVETSKATALVFVILIGAAMLTAAFRGFGGEELVKNFLTNMPGGFWAQFLIVMGVIFLLGFFLDFIEIAVVVVPIVTPILLMDPGANVTAVWLGVMIGLNIQTSFLTPPFGFALFYLRGVAPPSISTLQIYKGVVPFILLQLAALFVVGYTPSLVNYWPIRLNLLSDVAPPPANPRLQHCIEQLVLPQYVTREAEIRAAIAKAKGLDYSFVPSELRSDLTGSFAKAEQVFEHAKAIKAAETAIEQKKPAYAPLHRQVREIQQDALRLDTHRRELEQDIQRLKRGGRDVTKLEATLAAEAEKKKALLASIPASWEADHKAFADLLKADAASRQRYRRTSDDAYQPVEKLLQTIDQTSELERRVADVKALTDAVQKKKPAEAVEQIDAVNKVVGALGGRTVRRELSRARSALRGRAPDVKKAEAHIQETLKLVAGELAWRKRASSELKPGLDAYDATIRTNIGLREQPRLPRSEALSVAACMANHRDVSLHF
ncbi:MAG: TRAP transporter large permease subunit [Hyphomicrobiaceae bacterium]